MTNCINKNCVNKFRPFSATRNRDVALGSPGRGGGATKHAFVHRP